MKQLIQNLRTGDTVLEEVPAPLVRKGCVLVKTVRSVVSLGTEKMLIEFSKGNILSKARQQPERVRQVMDKMSTEGVLPTLTAVFSKLDEPLPLGYCNSGEVIAVGEGVTGLMIGDRVASNGHHAEIVCVPKNLCAKIPDNVSYEEAAFTVLGAISLQGIRLANPTLGETVAVIGLGLIGLITVDLLVANGCNVIGFDFDTRKIDIARMKGARAFNATECEAGKVVEELTNNIGCDAVIITASTESNEVIKQAAEMSRKRGRVVLVGVVGLDIQRSEFFKKELSFQVSCSYGPGRYDSDYEQKGIDYPLPYVRWTEQRNFTAVLDAMSKGRLDVSTLITERVQLQEYRNVYGRLGKNSIASVLVFPETSLKEKVNTRVINRQIAPLKTQSVVIGVIGAGNFTKMIVLPSIKKLEVVKKYISSAGGLTATSLAKKFGFAYSTTDYTDILRDPEVNLVMITTQHHLHAKMVIECLAAGKNVFVEKPLAINERDLNILEQNYYGARESILLAVGYNRRFSPFIQKAKDLIGSGDIPINIIGTLNAGYIPKDVWVHDMQRGGGRIIGEACHYIDLMIYLTGSRVKEVVMNGLGISANQNTDNAIIILRFENGSQGVINYFSNGSKAASKERLEVYTQGRTLILDNFRKMYGYGFRGFSSMTGQMDKGHSNQFKLLVEKQKYGGQPLISFEDLVNTTKASFAAIESLKKGQWVQVKEAV